MTTDKTTIDIDKDVFSFEAVNATCYKYSGSYFCDVSCTTPDGYCVTLQTKNGSPIPVDLQKFFKNDLFDNQVRIQVNKEFGHIRDLIVEQAFNPISQPK